ncbi:MAG TPA: DMT family transporter [Acidimicrobiia bacterium]|nr:DMT family transporter [Acidimicrobiia bacterium]
MTLLAAVAGAVAISFSAILYSLAEVSPSTGAFFRLFYALPILFILWWSRRDQDRRSPKRRLVALVAGILLGLDILVWHIAIEYIGAGLSTLIANSQVVVVALAAWILLDEKPSREVAIAVPVVLLGVSLVSGLGRGDAFGSSPVLGTILALASAVLYAGFILGFRVSNEIQAPSAGPLLESTAGAALAILVTSLPFGGLEFAPTWPAHGWLLTLALTSQVAGWMLIGYALPRLPAVETATIILLQPVLTMIWAVLIFSEQPSRMQWIGAALVLVGVGFVALTRSRRAVAVAPIA